MVAYARSHNFLPQITKVDPEHFSNDVSYVWSGGGGGGGTAVRHTGGGGGGGVTIIILPFAPLSLQKRKLQTFPKARNPSLVDQHETTPSISRKGLFSKPYS